MGSRSMSDQWAANTWASRRRAVAALIAAAGVVALAAGCGGAPRAADRGSAEPVNTGLSALMNDDAPVPPARLPDPNAQPDVGQLAAQAAMDLESLMNSGALDPRRRSAGPSAGLNGFEMGASPGSAAAYEPAEDPVKLAAALASADEVWKREAEIAAAKATPVEPEAVAAAEPVDEPEPVRTVEDEVVELAARIAAALRLRAAEAASGPASGLASGAVPSATERAISESMALAPIEALRQGTLTGLDDPAGLLAARLSEADLETLRSARDRLIESPLEADRAFARSIGAVLPEDGLTIGVAELCTRVTAFGRYTPFASKVFAAGQAHRMIVYTEIDGFTYREARAGDPVANGVALSEQESVELSQSVTLYQADGYQAWHKPAETVIETTRGRRRDFYLVQLIELPRTLAAGQYNLKVTVKDKVSGAEAERVVGVELKAYN